MTALLDELREALDDEPLTATGPDRVIALLEHDLKSWHGTMLGDAAWLHGGLAKRVARERMERQVVENMRRALARAMAVLGLPVEERAGVLTSVRVAECDDETVVCVTFDAPELLHRYLDELRSAVDA